MGFLSSIGSGIKDAVSSGWDSFKEGVKDFTGLDSMNDFFNPIAQGTALLQGRGIIGETLQPLTDALTGVPGQIPGQQQMTGPLMGNAPASLTMGAGPPAAPETTGRDIAGLFGESGYSYGGPTQTSTALLQANPEAYQFNPLFGQG